jgi:hypothetical protein
VVETTGIVCPLGHALRYPTTTVGLRA